MFLWVIALLSLLSVSSTGLRLGAGKKVPSSILDKSLLSPPPYQLPLIRGTSPVAPIDRTGVLISQPLDSFPPNIHSALVIVVHGGEKFQTTIFAHISHLRDCPTHYASRIPIVAIVPDNIAPSTSLQVDQILTHFAKLIVISVYEPKLPTISSHDSPSSQILLSPLVFPEINCPNSELYNYIYSHIAHGTYPNQIAPTLPPKFILSRRYATVEHVSIMLFSPDQSAPKLIHYLSSLVALQDHQSEHGHKHYIECLGTQTRNQRGIILSFPSGLWLLTGIGTIYAHCRRLRWTQRLHLSTLALLACAPLGPTLLSRAIAVYAAVNPEAYNSCTAYNRLNLISLGAVILSIQVDMALKSNICLPIIISVHIVHDTIHLLLRQRCQQDRHYNKNGETLIMRLFLHAVKVLQLVRDHISPTLICPKQVTPE